MFCCWYRGNNTSGQSVTLHLVQRKLYVRAISYNWYRGNHTSDQSGTAGTEETIRQITQVQLVQRKPYGRSPRYSWADTDELSFTNKFKYHSRIDQEFALHRFNDNRRYVSNALYCTVYTFNLGQMIQLQNSLAQGLLATRLCQFLSRKKIDIWLCNSAECVPAGHIVANLRAVAAVCVCYIIKNLAPISMLIMRKKQRPPRPPQCSSSP